MGVWEWAAAKAVRVYNGARAMTRWQWVVLASLPLLWWALREEEAK